MYNKLNTKTTNKVILQDIQQFNNLSYYEGHLEKKNKEGELVVFIKNLNIKVIIGEHGICKDSRFRIIEENTHDYSCYNSDKAKYKLLEISNQLVEYAHNVSKATIIDEENINKLYSAISVVEDVLRKMKLKNKK